jgi:hypothetical protein
VHRHAANGLSSIGPRQWDCCAELTENEDGSLHVQFETAWSFPSSNMLDFFPHQRSCTVTTGVLNVLPIRRVRGFLYLTIKRPQIIEVDHRLTRLPWQRLPAVTIAHRTLVDFAVYADNSLVGLPRLPKRDQCADCGGEIFAAHQQVVAQGLVVNPKQRLCIPCL